VRNLLIAGAGGHGKVVAEAAMESGGWERIAFADDRFPGLASVYDWPVLGRIAQVPEFQEDYPDLAVAIGNNCLRMEWLDRFQSLGFQIPVIIHPRAYVGGHVAVQPGTVILAKAAINIGTRLGRGCIINTAAVVEHDCELGDGVHVSPGANVAGGVFIGDCSWIGIGASLIQEVRVGKNVTVGAGAVIIKDIADALTVVGVPGKPVCKNR
jgi:sugar O-acyltransferase (sialic acid O-acetyltransferase NeuD family)